MWGIVGDPDGDFEAAGRDFVDFLIERCELNVGCGIGRNAVPLVEYFDDQGRYEGFDIVRSGIDWCQKNISRRYPNSNFQLADIYNSLYNPKGRLRSYEYVYPYANESFDVVFLTSVFTHMLPSDVEHYFKEIARVLKPGGRCLISFYLLNQSKRKDIEAGLSMFDFKFEVGGCRAQHKENPEHALAYEEDYVRELFHKVGLSIVEPILYGTWSSQKEQGQDIIMGTKPLKSHY